METHRQNIESIFLESAIKRFGYYKELGEKTFQQLEEKDFFYRENEASNSIAIIIQHMAGNMLSRWSNFLTEDGEKNWRNRDAEFENAHHPKEESLDMWEKGWSCLLNALETLKPEDLTKKIYIRSEPLLVIDAVNRQLAHYSYHVGQIIYIAKTIKNEEWRTLTIPKGQSGDFNQQMKTR
jgi:hypothetical protein